MNFFQNTNPPKTNKTPETLRLDFSPWITHVTGICLTINFLSLTLINVVIEINQIVNLIVIIVIHSNYVALLSSANTVDGRNPKQPPGMKDYPW